jgi:hypothetical protein
MRFAYVTVGFTFETWKKGRYSDEKKTQPIASKTHLTAAPVRNATHSLQFIRFNSRILKNLPAAVSSLDTIKKVHEDLR